MQQALFEPLKPHFKRAAQPVARGLVGVGVPANAVTIFGLALNVGVALLLAWGSLSVAGALLLLVNLLDLLDGAVARISGTQDDFGAMLDSLVDRYVELLIFFGLGFWFATQGDHLGFALAYATMAGSLLVSYARARAEGLGYGGEIGLVQRAERVVILGVALIFHPWLLLWALIILTVLTHVTAVQRLLHVHRLAAMRRR